MTIVDGDDNSRGMGSVKVFPESMRNMVSFRNGKLLVSANEEGIHQFKVIARSKFGIESAESFTFEALPSGWSSNLALVDRLRSKEVTQNKILFDSLDLANPDFQNLDRRLLSSRTTLILGTEILKNPSQLSDIEFENQV